MTARKKEEEKSQQTTHDEEDDENEWNEQKLTKAKLKQFHLQCWWQIS